MRSKHSNKSVIDKEVIMVERETMEFDVVIVGAGPAGLSRLSHGDLACALHFGFSMVKES